MKIEWNKPQLESLDTRLTSTFGCSNYVALGQKSMKTIYPDNVEVGTAGEWCCNCKRGMSGGCNGKQEFIKDGGTCSIS